MILRSVTKHVCDQNGFGVEAQRQIGVSPVDDHSTDDLVDLLRADAAMTAAAREYWLLTNFHLRLPADHKASAERLTGILTSTEPDDMIPEPGGADVSNNTATRGVRHETRAYRKNCAGRRAGLRTGRHSLSAAP